MPNFMLGSRLSLMIFLTAIICVSGLAPAFASSQLEVTIDPSTNITTAKMTYQRSFTIDYSQGGNLADTLKGKSDKIAFVASSGKL